MPSFRLNFLSFALILSLIGFSDLVLADISQLPQCAQLCASTTATGFGCTGFDDKQCLCTHKDASGNIQNYPEAVLRCPGMALCSSDDERATAFALSGFCDGIVTTPPSQNTTTTQQTQTTQQTTQQTTTTSTTQTQQNTNTNTQQSTTQTQQQQQQQNQQTTSTTGTNDDTTTVFTTVLTTPTDTSVSDPNSVNTDGSGAMGLGVTLTSVVMGLAVGMLLI